MDSMGEHTDYSIDYAPPVEWTTTTTSSTDYGSIRAVPADPWPFRITMDGIIILEIDKEGHISFPNHTPDAAAKKFLQALEEMGLSCATCGESYS